MFYFVILFPSQQVLQKIRGEADIEEYHNIKQSCLEAERELEKRSKSSWFYLQLQYLLSPAYEVRGKLMFSLCLYVHMGGEGYPSRDQGTPTSPHPIPSARTKTGGTHLTRTRAGNRHTPTPSQDRVPHPPRQERPQTGYGVGGTPLAFSCKRTFLFCSWIYVKYSRMKFPQIESTSYNMYISQKFLVMNDIIMLARNKIFRTAIWLNCVN